MEFNLGQILIKSIIESISTVIQTVWPMFALLFAVLIVRISPKLYKNYKLSKAGFDQIDRMTGEEFEKYLGIIFQIMGYKVTLLGGTKHDYGADLIIEKNGSRTAVQAKRHRNSIDAEAVRSVYGSMNMHECNKALVVTNSSFTEHALTIAKANQVELWGRYQLANKIISGMK